MSSEVNEALRKIRQKKPFIITLTNYFPMGYVASGIRSIGGFPIMCESEEELDEFLKIAGAIVINLGKVDDSFLKLCTHICQMAQQANVPIILDPVGASISLYRANAVIDMLQNHHIAILRAYPNEIASILTRKLSLNEYTQPIDNQLSIKNATLLAKQYNTSVVVSGKRHIVIDSQRADQFNFDSELVQKVAGITNLLSGIIATFHSVMSDPFLAAKSAVQFYAECVGPTSATAAGPASLIIEVIDTMYINARKAQLFT